MVSELLKNEVFEVLEISGGWAWGYCAHDHYVGYVRAEGLEPCLGASRAAAHSNDETVDFVDTALSYLDTPYVWGGRSHKGIDCSGLVQVALASAGIKAPRDADLQMAALGHEISAGTALKRGDLIFFPGHVGIMINDTDMVHATGFHHKTVVEPLAIVEARISEKRQPAILAWKRLK